MEKLRRPSGAPGGNAAAPGVDDAAARCASRPRLRFTPEALWLTAGALLILGAFVFLYATAFTDGGHHPCGVACRLETNTGWIETFALGVAIVALWITGLLRSWDHRSLARRFDYLLDQAVYECVHNLKHVADVFDGDTLLGSPVYTLRLVSRLTAEPMEAYLLRDPPGQRLWDHVDHICRNDEFLRRLPLQPRLDEGQRATPEQAAILDAATAPTKYLVEHMLRFVADAVVDFDGLALDCVLLSAVGAEDPAGRPLKPLADLLDQTRGTEIYVRFAASWLDRDETKEAVRLGKDTERTPLCWHDDQPPKAPGGGERPLAVGRAFGSLGDPPRPPRPRSRTR